MSEIEDLATKLAIGIGILMYIFGLLGNLMNICVFTRWCWPKKRTHNNNNNNNNNMSTSNSPIYLLVSSYANFIQIIYPLLTRIIFDGFQHQKTKENEIYTCKIRYFVLHTCDIISLVCVCIATLDRFFITSRNARLRQMSTTRKHTIHIIILIIIIILLHNIPICFYSYVLLNGQCTMSSTSYLYYYLIIIQICFHGIFPIFFLSIFGSLTYKQIKSIPITNNRRLLNRDKQLSRMLYLLAIAILLSAIPYSIENIYLVVSKDFMRDLTDYGLLFYYLAMLLFFTNPVLSFYIFFISTPNFRRQLRTFFFRKVNLQQLANNQVNTITSGQ